MKNSVIVPLVLVLALVMGASEQCNGTEIIIECDPDSCAQTCQDAYGSKLIRSYCQPLPGDLSVCICVYNP